MENKITSKIIENDVDIIVVGAGLVGLSAAIAFAQQGKQVLVVDAKSAEINPPELSFSKSWDARIYALTPATEDWLKALGVWQYVDASRMNNIHAMHLWNDGLAAPLILADSDANLTKLGVIAESANLMHALRARLDALAVSVLAGSPCKKIEYTPTHIRLMLENDAQLKAKLLVAADGVHSFVRQQLNITTKQKDFAQTAIVTNFLAEKNHDNIARQWFAPHETLALLPLPSQQVSMVWAVSTESATQLLKLTVEELALQVAEKSNNLLGALKPVSEVLSFELQQVTATQLIAERVAFVGDAAHQIHPMAGQGMNLGFRDVIALQALLANAHGMQDIGENIFLRQYERVRKADIASMHTLTSGLDYLFAGEQGILRKLSGWGMRQLSHQPFIKKVLIKHAVA